ncbi:branched-chain amino acid ABC transporter substrate-binding protein [Rubrivivax benzoatilyticus]|uniref:Branched-chain amino acid ABC transporter substrate-binding protein n=1 Tax=Rubrivivax benzoatilyticus TaxID=316997 RepID=A0ABX0HRF3_9BURK|nr:branched-chain amino acid ABC transporter substrate-binding protein [Rubrivivax benzoatilyticus]EGJ11175.1 putative transporter signal peptide protein [Rubrivivax benzoatilyticus JA2 = ATCC BAA-35]NHK97640.1 branched-chain amino acid ABC transporter substrate-binding protein [Rubrivivax benzoatilyticus]NHL22665.1 branched-chain amino acid ABC transporter substrate-binding protein [Rubrivivax benzoatilyticus]
MNPSSLTRRAWLALAAAGLAAPLHAQPQAAPIKIALIEGLSGAFANAGDAVARNIQWAVERVNARGGVRLPGGARPLELVRLDSKGSTEEALSLLRAALDQRIAFVLQGNSSATAAALIDALDKHNAREPDRRAIFLNYSAVDPALTNERCSFWHFRFDAHADMRLAALTDVLQGDRAVKKVYLIGQDYSFGQHVNRKAREMIAAKRPDIEIVGDELHPMGRVKDFIPYATKIKTSGAQAVLTGNWGNDLTLLVRALREVGSDAKLYTFYGNALGAPAAVGDAGIGSVLAVAEWHPNVGGAPAEAFYAAFRKRFPDPREDYVHARMQVLVEMLAAAIERARGTEAAAVAHALEGLSYDGATLGGLHRATMRAEDHQLQQPLVVSVMERAGTREVPHDVEGSGYGFKTLRRLDAAAVAQPSTCRMIRPR